MNKLHLTLISCWLCSLTINNAGLAAPPDEMPMKITLEDIFKDDTFKLNEIENIQWQHDSRAYLFSKTDKNTGIDIYRHTLGDGKETLWLAHKQLTLNGNSLTIKSFRTIPGSENLLLIGERKKIWADSFSAAYYIYERGTQNIRAVANGADDLVNVSLSPDGQWLAYTQQHNLYVAPLTTLEAKALTQDGSEDILNGVFDWAYEEEFQRADAYRWSPDSRKIAFWRTDQSRVKSFYLLDELPRYNRLTTLKYPKVGEQNARIQIGVVTINSGDQIWLDLGDKEDIYIPRLDWSHTADTLLLQRLNRTQNEMDYLLANTRNGHTQVIEKDKSTAWISIDNDTHVFKSQPRFAWTSERSGYNHIYITDYKQRKTEMLTEGEWEVSAIEALDETGQWLYFYGKKDSVLDQHLYRVSLRNRHIEKLSQHPGYHTASFSPDYQYYIQDASSIDTPPKISLHHHDGRPLRMLEDNALPAFKRYRLSHPEFIQIKTSDGVILNAQITRPLDFNPQKRYPVIMYAYGGPGSQRILNKWPHPYDYWDYYLAEQGYILFKLDNRGTGGRGTAFKYYSYGDFARWSVHDQIEGAKYLRSLSYVDGSRIGFWGKSFGGYLTGMLLTRGAEYFSTGIALAMVSDFLNYDTIWTERYMGLLADNKKGYDAINVLNYSKNLRGNLLLIHGSGDDNVHIQNTWQWVEQLTELNKPFDLMVYPNRNHGLAGGNTRLHMHSLMSRYFNQHLQPNHNNQSEN